MSYFAFVPTLTNGKGIVNDVIAIEQEQIDTGVWGDPSLWWQTSYNTHGNIHYGQDGQPDGGVALRANYAGIGYTYDSVNDVFYAPDPGAGWVLDDQTWLWVEV